jgi:outer membrane lipoprotein-sorting protein
MRSAACMIMAVTLTTLVFNSARADDKAAARAVLDKAIEAHGGEAELKKLQVASSKVKGVVHVMGMEVTFSGDAATQGPDRQRMDIEAEAGGQKFRIVHVFNQDKGWLKINDDVKEMDKDKAAESLNAAHCNWVATLIPLKEKDYTLEMVGEDKVDNRPAIVIRATRKDRRDINLFFDKDSHLLLKTERRAKEDNNDQEVTEETIYSNHEDKAARQPKKIAVKHDGKLFVEMEISDFKAEDKLDDSLFGKP